MTHTKSFLFITWEGGGNVPPVLGLAKRMAQRGHHVSVLTEPCLKQAVEDVGANYLAFQRYFTRTDRTQDFIQDWNAKPWQLPIFDNVVVGPIASVVEDTLAAIDKVQANAVVADCMMLGSLMAAEIRQVKSIVLFHLPEYLPGPNRPPGGFGLKPGSGWLGKVRNNLLEKAFYRTVNQYLPQVNKARKSHGLPEHKNTTDALHLADLRLIQTSKQFDFPIEPAPKNVLYSGPILDDPDWTQTTRFDRTEKPLVVVSLSTTFQNQKKTLKNIIQALGNFPIQGLVTLGPAMNSEDFLCPANVTLVSGIPHSEVFPIAKLVVTHGGHGTVMRALSHGLPLLVMPMGRDQNDNGARVEEHGAGISLSPNASSNKISKALKQLLENESFAIEARRIQPEIDDESVIEIALKRLEDLVSP